MKPTSVTSSKALLFKPFTLIPFPASNVPAIEITGTIARQENKLSIHYVVKGDIENILLPAPATSARKDDLWKATCFEFFLAIPDLPEYWEVNLSPSGSWNIYHMDAYRRIGFREESAISDLPFEFQQREDELALDVSLRLTSLLRAEQNLQTGITSIIQAGDGNETYWALTHPDAQADFHLRESFGITL